jgi:hypothetical protein
VEQRERKLAHRFNYEHPGIDGLLGKMASERAVGRSEMTSASNGEGHEIDGVDRVHEQHGSTVREQTLQFRVSERDLCAGAHGHERATFQAACKFLEVVRKQHAASPK